MKGLFALLIAGLLAGCASGDSTGIVGKVAEAKQGVIDFTHADLELASEMAKGADDKLAAMCWDYLMTVVPEDATALPTPKGAASAFQRVRNTVKRTIGGASDDLKANCGPLYLDAKDDVNDVAGKIASLALKLGVKLPAFGL